MRNLSILLAAAASISATPQNVLYDGNFSIIGGVIASNPNLSNQDFYPTGINGFRIGWQTTNPSGLLEIWGPDTQSATGYAAPSGSTYIAEMNSDVKASLYQIVQLDQASPVSVFFQHRGRAEPGWGINHVEDKAGFSIFDLGPTATSWDFWDPNSASVVPVFQSTVTSTNTAWRKYSSGSLFTPIAGNRYAFVFDSISSGVMDSYGNLIADVKFGYDVGIAGAGIRQLTNQPFSTSYYNAPEVPEPSTYGLVLGGIVLGLAAWRRRRS